MSESRTTNTRSPVADRATAPAAKLAIPSSSDRMDSMMLRAETAVVGVYRLLLLLLLLEEGEERGGTSIGTNHVEYPTSPRALAIKIYLNHDSSLLLFHYIAV